MTPRDLYKRWNKNFTGLLNQGDSLLQSLRRTGDASTVHDLRVTLRRARLHAHLGARLLPAVEARRLHDWGRALNRLLGPVRDCDVASNWIADQADPEVYLTIVHRHRQSVWATTASQLDRLNPGSCPHPETLSGHSHKKLCRQFELELDSTRSKVIRTSSKLERLTPTQRHALRRRVRRWRYLRELELPPRKHRKDRLLRRLNHTQDALGELQNLRVTQTLLRKVLPAGEPHPWTAVMRKERVRHLKAGRRHLKALHRSVD